VHVYFHPLKATIDFSYQPDMFFKKEAFDNSINGGDAMTTSYKDGRLVQFILCEKEKMIIQKGYSNSRKQIH